MSCVSENLQESLCVSQVNLMQLYVSYLYILQIVTGTTK